MRRAASSNREASAGAAGPLECDRLRHVQGESLGVIDADSTQHGHRGLVVHPLGDHFQPAQVPDVGDRAHGRFFR